MIRHLRAQENNAPDVSIFVSLLSVSSQRVDAAQHLKFKYIVEWVFIEFHLQKLSQKHVRYV